MQATKEQKIAIRRNCNYNIAIKEEWVQWATDDSAKTSLNDLSFEQAHKIIAQQIGNPTPTILKADGAGWAQFDKTNKKHRVILSLLYQLQWVKPSEKWGEVPDLVRLSHFLQSNKSPVKKKLKAMKPHELEKIIKALTGITKHHYGTSR